MQQRALITLALGLTLVLVLALVAVFLLAPRVSDGTGGTADVAATWGPPATLPARAAEPTGPGVQGLVDPLWLADTAESTGIPALTLSAYAGVAIAKNDQMASCGLGWNTLAAIGWAESRHGTHGGSVVGPDGTVSPAIIGVALDGGSTEVITDTDGGVIDGDTEHDRAVGPMQLIPQTWKNWHVDANADGVEDPQNIVDAAMASANYLCRSSGDMTTESGWRAGVAAYNSAPAYIAKVAQAATDYGS